MLRAPFETYVSTLIIRGKNDLEIIDELRVLGLMDGVDNECLSFLRSRAPGLAEPGEKLPKIVKDWADLWNLSYELIEEGSKRVRTAKQILFHSYIRHVVNLSLIDPSTSWDQILESLSQIGTPVGITAQMLSDYQKLFWSFHHMSLVERRNYFDTVKATAGMYAALDGRPQIGFAIDFGIPLRMSDVERLEYVQATAFQKYCEDYHTRKLEAKDARAWASTLVELSREVRSLQPPDAVPQVIFDSGMTDFEPSIDRLLLEDEEEEEESEPNVVPLEVSRRG
jgi:hypothetical protein